jgi:hypothetical protein
MLWWRRFGFGFAGELCELPLFIFKAMNSDVQETNSYRTENIASPL